MATAGPSSGAADDSGTESDAKRFYIMTADPKGICLIINNKTFTSAAGAEALSSRSGTDCDRDALESVFEGLKFSVQCHNDVSAADMTRLMHDMARLDHSDYDCFACCILTHGRLGEVFGIDGVCVEIRDLTAALKPSSCPSLAGKPKLFFVQACQGKKTQVGFPTAERDSAPMELELVPNEGDFLLSYATVPGFESYRDPSSGSVYVKKLTELLRKFSAREDILSILTMVNDSVGQEHSTLDDGHAYKQTSAPLYTLRKKLVLGPGTFTTAGPRQESPSGSGAPSVVVADTSPQVASAATFAERKKARCTEKLSTGSRPVKKYTVEVFTGDQRWAGTDANVYVIMFGDRKESKEIKLHQSETNRNKFERGKMDRFAVEAPDLGALYMVQIRHDNSAGNASWYLDRVEVIDPADSQKYIFHCERWLSTKKEDGKIQRSLYVKGYDDEMSGRGSVTSLVPSLQSQGDADEGPGVLYKVKVTTGDVPEAGTDSKISIIVFGAKGSTEATELENNDVRFERARTNTFMVHMSDVAPLKKLRVIVEAKSGSRKLWCLQKIELHNMKTGTLSVFKHYGWLGKDEGGAQASMDIAAIENGKAVIDNTDYRISVKISNRAGAGTDANVFVLLFGTNGDSGDLHLEKSETNTNPFERNKEDVFTVKGILRLGEVSRLRVWHDNKGTGAAWHLASIEVEDLSTRKVSTFHCDRWLSKSKGDKQIVRELTCADGRQTSAVTYEVVVHTGKEEGAGTNANVSITIFGVNGNTGKRALKQGGRNLFKRGQVDKFPLEVPDLGELTKIRMEHDNSGFRPGWFLDRVEVFNASTKHTTVFSCGKWFDRDKDDGEIARDVFPQSH